MAERTYQPRKFIKQNDRVRSKSTRLGRFFWWIGKKNWMIQFFVPLATLETTKPDPVQIILHPIQNDLYRVQFVLHCDAVQVTGHR